MVDENSEKMPHSTGSREPRIVGEASEHATGCATLAGIHIFRHVLYNNEN